MSLSCPSCKRELPAENVNVQAEIGKCDGCNEVFLLNEPVPEQGASPRSRAEVPRPANIEVHKEGDELTLRIPWYTFPGWIGLVFGLVLLGVAGYFFNFIRTSGDDPPQIMYFLPGLFVLLGIGFVYFSLAFLLNRTVVHIGPKLLTVRHGPVFWLGNRDLPTSEISQVYCTPWGEVRHQTSSGLLKRKSYARAAAYQVSALLKDGRYVALLRLPAQEEQAFFVERTIEEHLKIADRPVAGELPKST